MSVPAILNNVNLVGRVGRDPEVKYFDSGSVLTKLSLAVNRRSKNSDPDWFELELWGKIAEVAANYTHKGSLIGVIGELKIQSWTDRNTGAKRTKPVIKVNNLELLGKNPNANGSAANTANSTNPGSHLDNDF